MPRSFHRLGRFAARAAASSSSSASSSETLLHAASSSPDAAVARSLYRALLRVSRKLDASETAKSLVALPDEFSPPSSSASASATAAPASAARVAAAAIDRHFLRGARFYDPRRSAGRSLEGAVRASFRGGVGVGGGERFGGRDGSGRRRGGGGIRSSGPAPPPPPPGLLLDAGFSALRFLGGLAAVAERHGLLSPLDCAPTAATKLEEDEPATAAAPAVGPGPSSALTQRLSSPSAGALLLPHPALRGAFARTPVLLLEVLSRSEAGKEEEEEEEEGRKGGGGRRRRARRRGKRVPGALGRRGSSSSSGGEGAAALPPPPPPPVRASAGALGAGAVGLALGAPFAPLPASSLVNPKGQEGEGDDDAKRRRLLTVADLARSSRPLAQLARLVSDLSARGCRRSRSSSGGGGVFSSSSRSAGSAGLELARRRRQSGGGGGEALSPPEKKSRRPKPPPRTLSLSFSPVGERVSGDGTVGPAGIAITVGVVRERAGGRRGGGGAGESGADFDDGESDFDDDDFDDDESDFESDELSSSGSSPSPALPAIEAADRFQSEMDRAFREEGISLSSSSSEGGEGEGEDSSALRAALALGFDVSAFDVDDKDTEASSRSPSSSPAESRLLWGGPVPGLTALHGCEEAGGDAVVLSAPLSSSAPSPSGDSSPPPTTVTLFVDGDMKKLMLASSSSSSSASSPDPLPARVFVGTSLWAPGQLEGEIAAGAWAVAAAPPQSVLSLLGGGFSGPPKQLEQEEQEEGDGRVLWERSLRECGLGAWARVKEEAVEEAARVGF